MSNWFKQMAQRLIWAHRAFVAEANEPIIKLDNGIALDLNNNRIILEGDFALHVTGNMSLTSDGYFKYGSLKDAKPYNYGIEGNGERFSISE